MAITRPGRSYRGAASAQRRDQRRAQLLGAAVEIFGTTGYRSATVEKICATAGLTKRYFYESFDSSEDLLVASYEYATEKMRDGILAAAAGAPVSAETGTRAAAETMLQAALAGYFRTIAEDPRLARIAFVEILGVSGRIDALYRETTRSFADTVLQLAETIGDSAHGLSGPHRRTLAMGLVGAVLIMAQQWLLDDESEPLESVIASAHTILAAVVFGQVATP